MNRSIEIPQSCSGVARFDFEYLCGRPVISHSLNLHFSIIKMLFMIMALLAWRNYIWSSIFLPFNCMNLELNYNSMQGEMFWMNPIRLALVLLFIYSYSLFQYLGRSCRLYSNSQELPYNFHIRPSSYEYEDPWQGTSDFIKYLIILWCQMKCYVFSNIVPHLGKKIHHPYWWDVQSSLPPYMFSYLTHWQSISRNWGRASFWFREVTFAFILVTLLTHWWTAERLPDHVKYWWFSENIYIYTWIVGCMIL